MPKRAPETVERRIRNIRTWRPLFLAKLAEQGNVTRACEAAGVDRGTVYIYRRQSEDFAALWDDAIQTAADALEEEAWRRAKEGIEEPVYQQGEQVGTITRYNTTLLIFLLKGIRPEKYRDNYSVEHKGKIEIPPPTIVLQIGDRPPRVLNLGDLDIRSLSRDELEVLRELREKNVIEGEFKVLPPAKDEDGDGRK